MQDKTDKQTELRNVLTECDVGSAVSNVVVELLSNLSVPSSSLDELSSSCTKRCKCKVLEKRVKLTQLTL